MRDTFLLALLPLLFLLSICSCNTRKGAADNLLARIDSLADVNPDSADMLLKPTPIPSLKGRENEEVCKLLRIKTDDKLYRPVTHYRDTILQLIDYFEYHPKVLSSLLGSTGPALPYLYAGRIFADLGDAPQALDYYQQALDAIPVEKCETDNAVGRRLAKQRGLILSQIGEQFFFQGLYHNALDSYRHANEWAKIANDTADIIFNLRDIAEQFKFLERIDSSLLFYQQALSMAKDYKWQKKCNELMSQISSLYIRMGDFKLASEYMRPSLENVDTVSLTSTYAIASKVYKHLGKDDSAIICYHKLLEHGNLYGKSFAHKELAELSLRNHKTFEANQHLLLYNQFEDSLRKSDKAETVARMHAAYNYQKHVKEAQRLKEANTLRGWLICLGILVLLVLLFLLLWVRAKARERKLRLLELHRIHEELQAKYALLTEDKANNHSYASRLAQLEKEKIWVSTRRIQESDVFKKLLQDSTCAVSNQEIWDEVERVVNEAYPGFSDRLRLLLPSISAKEKQVSLLLKAQLTHQLIAEIICETQNGESNIRRRLSKKLFPSETPSSSKFDDFIGSL